MKLSKCCNYKIDKEIDKEEGIENYYCLKCGLDCEVIEPKEEHKKEYPCGWTEKELQRADDIIGHDVSGTESRQMKEEVKDKSFNSDYCKGYIQGQRDASKGKWWLEEKDIKVGL